MRAAEPASIPQPPAQIRPLARQRGGWAGPAPPAPTAAHPPPPGGLPATTDTLAGFGIAITSFNASNAANAEAEFAFQDSLHRDLLNKSLSFSGVNIDEEMANMVLYQNAYQASARLVQAADELFAILVNLGQ